MLVNGKRLKKKGRRTMAFPIFSSRFRYLPIIIITIIIMITMTIIITMIINIMVPEKKDAVLSSLEFESEITSPVRHLHAAHLRQPNLMGKNEISFNFKKRKDFHFCLSSQKS